MRKFSHTYAPNLLFSNFELVLFLLEIELILLFFFFFFISWNNFSLLVLPSTKMASQNGNREEFVEGWTLAQTLGEGAYGE